MPFTSWASHPKTLQREALRVSLRHFVVSEPPPRFCQQGGSQDRGRQSQGPVGEMPSVAVCSANTTPLAPESRAVSCNDVAVHAAGTVKPR